MSATLRWWLICCLQAFGLGVAAYFGLLQKLIEVDPTRISLGLFVSLLVATCWIGLMTWRFEKHSVYDESAVETGWFMSDLAVSIGMIGTVIGLIMIIDASLGSLGSATVQDLPKLISQLGVGIGTKLWTTLAGLVTAVSLKVQLRNLEACYEQ